MKFITIIYVRLGDGMRTYKIILSPNEEEKRKLEKKPELCIHLYNHFLEELNEQSEISLRYGLQETFLSEREAPRAQQMYSESLRLC